jgi:hypothetical protein
MLPTHFRWLWYLVGLAGMALMIVGIIGILGSAADLGIVIPLVVVVAIGVGYALMRFNRSLDAALAAAPSRQPGASGSDDPPEPGPDSSVADAGPAEARPVDDPAAGPSAPLPMEEALDGAPPKPPSGPPRTGRRGSSPGRARWTRRWAPPGRSAPRGCRY